MYKFQKQLKKGETQEKRLDSFFSAWYDIQFVSHAMQRRGIDRIYRKKGNGHAVKIEYKSDWTASQTGNVFIEIVSIDLDNKPGWAYTSEADILIYFLPDDNLAYILRMSDIRNHLNDWIKKYPMRAIPNRGYHTHGLIVPQWWFEKLAIKTVVI